MAPPVTTAATGSKIREPNLSNSQPTVGLVTELDTWRAVWAQPKKARPIPSSSPIGLMNRPKFSDPIAMLTAPAEAMEKTIIQP